MDELKEIMIWEIFDILHLLFLNKEQANKWIKKNNINFDCKSALDKMLYTINGISKVHFYLKSQLYYQQFKAVKFIFYMKLPK